MAPQFFLLLVLWNLFPTTFSPVADWRDKLDPSLLPALETGRQQPFILILKTRADLSRSAYFSHKTDKTRYVYARLLNCAERTQSPLIKILEDTGAPYRSLYIVNAIYTRGDLALAERLARHPETERILANPESRLSPPTQANDYLRLRSQAPEWGVQRVQAPEVWAMGYRGEGVVVGGQDTGYDWQHPALRSQYRGNQNGTVDHNYHWFDAITEISPLSRDSVNNCGLQLPAPCDDNDHGTHTMGTVVGDDGQGNQIGVAPAARWIGVRNMEEGWGNPFSYTLGFQWFLAPTDLQGENPNPDLAPDVIVNSWYCPELEGCNPGNRAMLEMAADNLRAAGIFVVVSAGNSGDACATINEIPAAFPAAFAVGATDSRDSIAPFSSRGPVYTPDSSNLFLKPDVTAPGVNVRSAVRFGGYKRFSGTSMAGPHVAGVVALMLSANPELKGQVEVIEEILRQTARPMFSPQNCAPYPGNEHPNPVYGYGIVDAKAAVEEALRRRSTSTTRPHIQKLQVYPNPTDQVLFLKGIPLSPEARVHLYDAMGRTVRSGPLLSNRLDVSQLLPGLYSVQVTKDRQRWSTRVVIR